MTQAQSRFVVHLRTVEQLLTDARRKKDPATFLYQSGFRDIIFKLEGLSRIYRQYHDKKIFESWYKEFKQLEDLFGRMDHSDSMLKEFSQFPSLRKKAETTFLKEYQLTSSEINNILKTEGWLSGEKTTQMLTSCDSFEWYEEEKDRKAFAESLIAEAQRLVRKIEDGELNPHITEAGLHEIRRRLRWISIYAGASQGLIQIKKTTPVEDDLKKYQQPDIVQSPYNKFPKPAKGTMPLVVQAHHYYALSYMIQWLGTMKDNALSHEAFGLLTAGKSDENLARKFLATLAYAPGETGSRVEIELDRFIYRDRILNRINRDLLRCIQ